MEKRFALNFTRNLAIKVAQLVILEKRIFISLNDCLKDKFSPLNSGFVKIFK